MALSFWLGYIDEEGNERDKTDGYQIQRSFPDIDIRYRHDQDMSGERPKPYTWAMSAGGEPSTIRKKRGIEARAKNPRRKMRRENEENWKRRYREMKE